MGAGGVESPRAVVAIFKPPKSLLGSRHLFSVTLRTGHAVPEGRVSVGY